MSQVVGHRGYPTVQLWKDRTRKLRTVHQLMMESFVGPRQQGIEVDHIDGNKLNNSLNNLEYVSKRENLRRRDALGLTHRGERTGGSKLKDSNITEILSLRYKGESYSSIAKKLGVSTTAIFNAAKGRTWRHVER